MIAWHIALRYLFSRKSHAVVNVISAISVAGVAVATAAIVIVLSVFNGFSAISEARLSALDPQIKLLPSTGKAWHDADSVAAVALATEGVAIAAPVIEERGLAVCGSQQKPVIFKGVPADYASVVNIGSVIIDGLMTDSAYDMAATVLSVGVALGLEARPGMASIVELYAPRRVGRINPANPSAAFRGDRLMVTGVTQIDQPEYDNDYMVIPLGTARQLLDYDTEASAIELRLQPGTDADAVAKALSRKLGAAAQVLTRQQQEADSFRMIQVEKWITFMMLTFILVIASFNIISTLSLLAIEKRDNMYTLRSMGATRGTVRRIFMWLGMDVSVAGGISGIILGSLLVLVQQWGHVIKLAGDASHMSILYYPVRLEATDLLAVLALIAAVSAASGAIAMALAKIKPPKTE